MDRLLKSLEVFKYDNKKRIGRNTNGGHVIGIFDDNIYDSFIECGITYERSFTISFLNLYNYLQKGDCHVFDANMKNYPLKYLDKVTYFKKIITDSNNEKETNLSDIFEKYDNIFLKVDLKDYIWLSNVSTDNLKKFKQMVITFHDLANDVNMDEKISCLEKLKQTHCIIHAHASNNKGIQDGIPEILEVTYASKELFEELPELNNIKLPISGLDHKNNMLKDDIELIQYPFVTL